MTDDEEFTSQNKKQDSTESTESTDSAKRLKTDDSGVYVDTGTSSDEVKVDRNEDISSSASTSFHFRPTNSKARHYRRSDEDSDDSSVEEKLYNCCPETSTETADQEAGSEETSTTQANRNKKTTTLWLTYEPSNSNSSSEDHEPDEDRESVATILNDSESEESTMEDPPVLSKEKPKHKWFMVPEILNRQLGSSAKYNSGDLFQQRCYGSLHSVQRLELMYKLEKHEGCVNSLNFHPNGSLLASGSDDLNVVVWDWPVGKPLVSFDTKHKGNVFQCKFMPLSGDLHIVTCARDGQVRLHQVSQTEGVRCTRRLGMHRGPTHKLALLKDQPHIVLSAGEDGCVISHDVRVSKPVKLLTVQSMDERKIALYSINSHPLNSHQFCVSGRDHVVRIYDQRKISPVMNSFFPGHIKKKSDVLGLHVTCAMYNYNGTEILASYNDDDIYLFDASTTSNHFVHCYQGHRNGATIKGVNFFGPKSEYIVSGSDCGNIYFWDKNTESIVQCMLADDNGVVNCLEPHPQLPMLCTSGLDWDIKVWVPSHEHEPEMLNLSSTVRRNHRCRITERMHTSGDINDSQMLWMLWRHLRTTERLQRYRTGTTNGETEAPDAELTLSEDSSSSNDGSSGMDDEDLVRPLTCSPS